LTDRFRWVRVAVLVSGSGTILEAMIAERVPIAVVAADRPCRGLQVADEAGIASELVPRESFTRDFDRVAYSRRMADLLTKYEVDLVAMAGFGTIFAEPMFDAFGNRILLTHPSLLPAFPGWHAVRDALDLGVKVTGCTVLVATVEVDAGRILAQEAVRVEPDDTEDTLHERIKAVERRLYPQTINEIVQSGTVPDMGEPNQ
jgi:phosphoribosylglycinamide formyltransferase-1